MSDPAQDFRRAFAEAGWELDLERLAAVLAAGGTIIAAEDVFAHLHKKLLSRPAPTGGSRFAWGRVEILRSKYLLPGQIVGVAPNPFQANPVFYLNNGH